MKRAITSTDSTRSGVLSTYQRVQTHQHNEGVKYVLDQLYRLAKDQTKTPQEIAIAQKNHVIHHFVSLSEDHTRGIKEALVIMTPKSNSSMTLHDFTSVLDELEKQAPDYLKFAIKDVVQTNLEDLITEGLASYNQATKENVTLDRPDLFTGFPTETIAELFHRQTLSEQINLSLTCQFHQNTFQNMWCSKLDSTKVEVTNLRENGKSYYWIYENLPQYRQFRFLADDERGLAVLHNMKLGGPKTVENIKNGTFRTREDALASRKHELQKLLKQWKQLPDDFIEEIVRPIVFSIHGQDEGQIELYVNGTNKITLELLIEYGIDSPYIKYIGDGSIDIQQDTDILENFEGDIMLNHRFEHIYVDTGLLPAKLSVRLGVMQGDLLLDEPIVDWIRQGLLTSTDIEEVLDYDMSENWHDDAVKQSWAQKLFDNHQIPFEQIKYVFHIDNSRIEFFNIKLVQQLVESRALPFETVCGLSEDKCRFLKELFTNQKVFDTVDTQLLSNLFSWKLDVLFNFELLRQEIEKDTELLAKLLTLPDYVEGQLGRTQIQKYMENGTLSLKQISEMASRGVSKFNEQMNWIDLVGNVELNLFLDSL